MPSGPEEEQPTIASEVLSQPLPTSSLRTTSLQLRLAPTMGVGKEKLVSRKSKKELQGPGSFSQERKETHAWKLPLRRKRESDKRSKL